MLFKIKFRNCVIKWGSKLRMKIITKTGLVSYCCYLPKWGITWKRRCWSLVFLFILYPLSAFHYSPWLYGKKKKKVWNPTPISAFHSLFHQSQTKLKEKATKFSSERWIWELSLLIHGIYFLLINFESNWNLKLRNRYNILILMYSSFPF